MYAWALVQGSMSGGGSHLIKVLPDPGGSDIAVEAELCLGLTLASGSQAIGLFIAINI